MESSKEYQEAAKDFHVGMLKQSLYLLKSSFVVYLSMTLIGLLLIYSQSSPIYELFNPYKANASILNLGFATMLLVLLGFIVGYLCESFFPSYQKMKRFFLVTLGPCHVWTAFFLAVLSGIGEEVLFRGGIQPYLGLVATSLIFGLIHLGPGGKVNAWSLAAGILGLLFGYVYQQTGSLLPGIVAHAAINFISITNLHFQYIQKFSPQPKHFQEETASINGLEDEQ